MAKKAPEPPKKGKKQDLPEWMTLKSGAIRHKDGKWYCGQYADGWFFYTKTFDNNLGPFKSLEEGLKHWKP
jgi:hypothetical protein